MKRDTLWYAKQIQKRVDDAQDAIYSAAATMGLEPISIQKIVEVPEIVTRYLLLGTLIRAGENDEFIVKKRAESERDSAILARFYNRLNRMLKSELISECNYKMGEILRVSPGWNKERDGLWAIEESWYKRRQGWMLLFKDVFGQVSKDQTVEYRSAFVIYGRDIPSDKNYRE